jgi:hypothetical protein
MFGWGAGYVRSTGYVWARGHTCPVISDLEVSDKFGQICLAKGADMSGQIWLKLTWKPLEN